MHNGIIILGCPRAGKTTLSNLLCEQDNYSIISLDSLISAFENSMPELGINKHVKISTKSKYLLPFAASYFHSFTTLYPNKKYILEGCQILPKDLIKQEIFKRSRIICLGYPNATINEIFNNIRIHDKLLPPSHSSKMSDEELIEHIKNWILYSQFLQKQCNILNIKYFETNKNRKKILNDAINYLNNDYERI